MEKLDRVLSYDDNYMDFFIFVADLRTELFWTFLIASLSTIKLAISEENPTKIFVAVTPISLCDDFFFFDFHCVDQSH